MIPVTCSHCGIRILVPPTVQGRKGTCFGCGGMIFVPLQEFSPQDLDITFKPGDRISNRYVLHERIGKGGMGVVYQAHDELVNEEVALKFMKPQILQSQKGVVSFIHEAQIARRLRHENIVAVHDISATENGILYLSMEFLRGHSLRALLRWHRQERKLIDVRFAVRILDALLSALEYAHRTVIHRDIKPENIMILPGERVKVLDFGLAKAIDAAISSSETVVQGEPAGQRGVIGTLGYASPEQVRHQPVDLRADIYTAGLLFYELLTLRTPHDTQVDLSQVRNDIAPSLFKLLDKARAVDREDRWPSAGEFRKQLIQAFEQSYRALSTTEAVTSSGAVVSTEDMVFLEGGRFVMGNNEVPEEAPEFEVQLEPFYIDKYPVRVSQYGEFLKATGHPEPRYWHDPRLNGPNQPVVGVSWEDARAYAAWANKQLPSEAQWEFAARGREDRPFPWGNLEPDSNLCNFADYLGMPSIVSMHQDGRTPNGLYDMGGNVYEWTNDPFVPYAMRLNNTVQPNQSPLRTVRGGCWKSPPGELRCSFRKGVFPESQLDAIGFRCVILARLVGAKEPTG